MGFTAFRNCTVGVHLRIASLFCRGGSQVHAEANTEDELGHRDESVDTTAPSFVFYITKYRVLAPKSVL